MKLTRPIPQHSVRLIAVPYSAGQPEEVQYQDERYKVIDSFVYYKDEPIPGGMWLLATGKRYDAAVDVRFCIVEKI